MANSSNIPTGLNITTQIPLNVKEWVKDEATLAYLGLDNNLAFTYHDHLEVFCLAEKTLYRWREVGVGEENTGLVPVDFTYPANTIVYDVDYSGKKYNFFPVEYVLTNNIVTYTGANVGTGIEIFKNITGTSTKTFNFKRINSQNLTITDNGNDIEINTPMSASIPALYVNNLYVPSEEDFLAGNTKGDGSLAKPFTDTVTAYTLGVPTIAPNTAIQNALDAYAGGDRLNPALEGQRITIQDNNTTYSFSGNFNYTALDLVIEGHVISTTAGYYIDMEDVTGFDQTTAVPVITLSGETSVLQIQGLGARNNGNSVGTNTLATGKTVRFLGDGYVFSSTNDITKYLFNSDIASAGNNNDGNLTFDVRCNVRAVYQGIYNVGGNSRIDFYKVIQSGDLGNPVNVLLKAFNQTGGQIRIFETATLSFNGVTRNNAITFEPAVGFTPIFIGEGYSVSGTATTMFNKLNTSNVTLSVINTQGFVTITNVFNSSNLWLVNFRNNTLTSGSINTSIVDLTQGNNVSSTNTIGNNVLQHLVRHVSKAAAITAGLGRGSMFTKYTTVTSGSFIVGEEYKIVNIANAAAFTAAGASATPTVGEWFVATAVGAVNGNTADKESVEIAT